MKFVRNLMSNTKFKTWEAFFDQKIHYTENDIATFNTELRMKKNLGQTVYEE